MSLQSIPAQIADLLRLPIKEVELAIHSNFGNLGKMLKSMGISGDAASQIKVAKEASRHPLIKSACTLSSADASYNIRLAKRQNGDEKYSILIRHIAPKTELPKKHAKSAVFLRANA